MKKSARNHHRTPRRLGLFEPLEPRLALTIGPELLWDLNSGAAPSSPGPATVINGMAYFAATNAAGGTELWKTDGTPAGTAMVKDILSGPGNSNPRFLTNVNGTLLFRANDGIHGDEVWKSDGTESGTVIVADVAALGQSSFPGNLVNVNGELYFTADSAASGNTTFFGPTPYLSQADSPFDLAQLGTNFWLEDFEDGLLNTLGASASFGSPRNPGGLTDSVDADDGTIDGDGLLGHSFLVRPENSGVTFTFDRQALSGLPSYVGIVVTGADAGLPENNVDFFDAGGNLIGSLVDDFPKPFSGQTSDDRFVGLFHAGGISSIRVSGRGIANSGFEVDHLQYGIVVQPTGGMSLYKLDIDLNTHLIQELGYQPQFRSLNAGGAHYFTGYDPSSGFELWKTNATGAELVKDIYPGTTSSGVRGLTNVNGSVFFSASDGVHGDELWVSNGTEAGTMLVKDINPGVSNSSLAFQTNLNGALVFSATTADNGSELWMSDGTPAGTVLLKEIKGGSGGSNPILLQNVNHTLFFTADDGTHFFELWKSDGTAEGTELVKDIFAGDHSSGPNSLAAVNGMLFFSADDGTGSGGEVWQSDGTEAGTVRVKDINPGVYSAAPRDFRAVGNRIIFSADDGAHGRELWTARFVNAAGTVNVDARSNIFGAGHAAPPGTAPGILPRRIDLPGGQSRAMQFSVTDQVSFDTIEPDTRPFYGADGGTGSTNISSTGGISGIRADTHGFLVGVFVGDEEPAEPAPAAIDFSGLDFVSFPPALNQTFFIGDGIKPTGAGLRQVFIVPEGAKRLYLGFADSFDPDTNTITGPPQFYDDNGGSLQVTYELRGTPLNAAPSFVKGPDVTIRDDQSHESPTTVISFADLNGGPDAPFYYYEKAGFTVRPTDGRWLQAQDASHIAGEASPAIWGDSYTGSLDITSTANGTFVFASVDLASWSFGDAPVPAGYTIQGFLGGQTVFTAEGEVPPFETSGFVTIDSPAGATVDTVRISLVRGSQAYIVDNIRVITPLIVAPTQITFDGLSGLTEQEEHFVAYEEGGFTVTPTPGFWSAFVTSSPTPSAEGNPAPSIWAGTQVASLDVARSSGGTFAFAGVDIFGPTVAYTFTGLLDGKTVFTESGVVPPAGASSFIPIISTTGATIDRLLILVTRNQSEYSALDNIRLVPSPYVAAMPWATAISAGPADEAQQVLHFVVTGNSDPELFAVPPTIDPSGNLIFVPRPNVSGTATITVQLRDSGGTVGGGVDASAAQSFVITITKPHRWHNTASPLDVDGDMFVTAGDALAIINYLNAEFAEPISETAQIGQPYGFLDTDKDDDVSPNDALNVINYLNAADANARASFLGIDATTQGDWQENYGSEGYNLALGPINLPANARVTSYGNTHLWAASAADARALQIPGADDRLAAAWLYNYNGFAVDVDLQDGMSHRVALYVLDWDGDNSRSERIEVLDANTGQLLNSQTVASFSGGQYFVWTLSGHVQIRLIPSISDDVNTAVLSGIFFG